MTPVANLLLGSLTPTTPAVPVANFAKCVVNTGGKFATGIIDTGGAP
jgi:hypothetical protein